MITEFEMELEDLRSELEGEAESEAEREAILGALGRFGSGLGKLGGLRKLEGLSKVGGLRKFGVLARSPVGAISRRRFAAM